MSDPTLPTRSLPTTVMIGWAKLRRVKHPDPVMTAWSGYGYGVIFSYEREDGGWIWHVSVSCQDRVPTHNELRDAVVAIIGDDPYEVIEGQKANYILHAFEMRQAVA